MRKIFFFFISVVFSLFIFNLNEFSYGYDSPENIFPITNASTGKVIISSYNGTDVIIIKNNVEEKFKPSSRINFSKNGMHYFFSVKQDGKYFIIKDGEKSKSYDYIDSDSSKMSDDGSSYTFVAKINQTNTGTTYVGDKYLIVKDGIESDLYSFNHGYSNLDYFPNSTDIFYFYNNIIYSPEASNDKDYIPIDKITSTMMINDKKVSKEYSGFVSNVYIIKHLPNTVVFSVKDKSNFYLVFNGKESKIYDENIYGDNGSYIGDVIVSPNGKSITYTLGEDPEGFYRIIKDDVEIGKFMRISNIRYSSDSKNILYDVQKITFSDRLHNVFAVFGDKSFHKFSMENGVEKGRIKGDNESFIEVILNNNICLLFLGLLFFIFNIYYYKKNKKFFIITKIILFLCILYLIYSRTVILLLWTGIIKIKIG